MMTTVRRLSLVAAFWLAAPGGRPAQAQAQARPPCDEATCLESGREQAPRVVSASPTPPLAVLGPALEEERSSVPSQPRAQRTLHGFRLGYMYVHDFDRKLDPDDPESSLEGRVDMKSPHLFLIGYEVTRRLIGHSWLNIILVGNVMVGGLEQSKFYPSANALIGFEFDESFQLGVGPNLTPDPDKVAHIVFAGGWTPMVGSFHVPVHAFYIPDVDGIWRTGMTLGVNW